jgi:hypothetical protein
MTLLAVIWLLPKEADAQCAVAYNDIYTDGTSVYVWNSVTDYYNQSGCNPGWSGGFFHYYTVGVGVQSPSGRAASNSGFSSAPGGGGYVDSSTSLAIQGEVGDFIATTTAEIDCSIVGLLYYVAAGQNVRSCADERTNIIQEYTQYSFGFIPTCPDFTQTRRSGDFQFSELNSGDYSWALVRDPFIAASSSGYGLDRWRDEYGGSRIMNSAYRNPVRNANVGGAFNPPSRHMFGDAGDLRNQSFTEAEWTNMSNAASRANADFIEPRTGPCGLACVHADWRSHSGGYQ